MPTAARLVAALLFAVIGFAAAEAFKPQMPPGTQFGYLSPICAALGIFSGWTVAGRYAGRGTGSSMGYGVRSAITIVFYALVLFSGYEMVLRSTKKIYHGPMEALQGMADLIAQYGLLLLNRADLIILIGGGIVAGVLVEAASRRWR